MQSRLVASATALETTSADEDDDPPDGGDSIVWHTADQLDANGSENLCATIGRSGNKRKKNRHEDEDDDDDDDDGNDDVSCRSEVSVCFPPKIWHARMVLTTLVHTCNLGLGTKYVFLHVGWEQNLNLSWWYLN